LYKNILFYSFIQSETLSQKASVWSAAVVFVLAIRSRIFYGPKGHCCPAADQRRRRGRRKCLLKSPVVPLYGSSTDGPGNGMFNLD
jgi:hypothetical protein